MNQTMIKTILINNNIILKRGKFMLIKLESNQNLNELLKENHSKPILIDFYAD